MPDVITPVQVAIIGGGPGGYVAAIRAAQKGLSVTLIESEALGGVCLNWGCIPSKALLRVGHLYEEIHAADALGIHIEGCTLEWSKTLAWKDGVVQQLTQGIGQLLKAHHVTVIQGVARFQDAHTLHISGSEGEEHCVTPEHIIIATGSRTMPISGVPIDGQQVWEARHALGHPHIPKRLLIVGAGVIGLEMAILFNQLGSQVHIIEKASGLLPGWEPDVVAILSKSLKQRGINIFFDTSLQWVERHEFGLSIQVESADGNTHSEEADNLLIAAGRLPNSDKLNLDAAGVETDERGFIRVDTQCRSNVAHIFAIGDVSSAPLLAHKASKEGIVAAEAIAGEPSALDNLAMPAAIFTDPELATVGMTQTTAEQAGYTVRVGRFPFAASGRALITDASAVGMIKLIADAETDRILGVHMIGPHVSDLLAEATLAIELGATAEDLSLTIHTHPTLSESLMEAAEATHAQAIHIFQP